MKSTAIASPQGSDAAECGWSDELARTWPSSSGAGAVTPALFGAPHYGASISGRLVYAPQHVWHGNVSFWNHSRRRGAP